MNEGTILFFLPVLLILVLGITFLIGVIFIIIGGLKINRDTKVGLILAGITPAAFVLYDLYQLLFGIFASQPSQKDLVGIYQVTKVTERDANIASYNHCILELKSDSTFTLTGNLGNITLACSKGKYMVNYESDENTLRLTCGKEFDVFHIDREIGFYRIELIMGDGYDGYSSTGIYFEKIKQ